MSERSIFRQDAVQALQRGRDRDVVPKLITWPIIAMLWALLIVLLVAAYLIWSLPIPTYIEARGIVVPADLSASPPDGLTVAAFMPPGQAAQLYSGLPADVGIGSSGLHLSGTVSQVTPATSPAALRSELRLSGQDALLVSEPSSVVFVRLPADRSAEQYSGSLVSIRVLAGSRRLIALLPVLGPLSERGQ